MSEGNLTTHHQHASTAEKIKLAQLTVQGQVPSEIAESMGWEYARVKRYLDTEEVQQFIEDVRAQVNAKVALGMMNMKQSFADYVQQLDTIARNPTAPNHFNANKYLLDTVLALEKGPSAENHLHVHLGKEFGTQMAEGLSGLFDALSVDSAKDVTESPHIQEGSEVARARKLNVVKHEPDGEG